MLRKLDFIYLLFSLIFSVLYSFHPALMKLALLTWEIKRSRLTLSLLTQNQASNTSARSLTTAKWHTAFKEFVMNMHEGNIISFTFINKDRRCFDRFSCSRRRLLIIYFERLEVKIRITSTKKSLQLWGLRRTAIVWDPGWYPFFAVLFIHIAYYLSFSFLFWYGNEKLNLLS